MNLLKRLKNIWRLGGYDLTKAGIVLDKDGYTVTKNILEYGRPEKPKRMATIIKRSTPSEDFIKNNKDE